MTFLHVTHTLLWVLGDQARVQEETRWILEDPGNAVFVSIVSLWEVALKCGMGKLDVDTGLVVAQLARASKIGWLELSPNHVATLHGLPVHQQHRDPFDPLLIAQAITEDMTFVTANRFARLYPVRVRAP